MNIATTYTYTTVGIKTLSVSVDVHISAGLPGFYIVGMAETAVRESRERVRSAILSSGFTFPQRRITVNLAPADLPKQGGGFDLPIALAILLATGEVVDRRAEPLAFVGELSLQGELRKSAALLPLALASSRDGLRLIHPGHKPDEMHLVPPNSCLVASSLLEACRFLEQECDLYPAAAPAQKGSRDEKKDLADVLGQQAAKKALEIAAAGGHNLLLCGPPGAGKSMLAERFPGILPQLSPEQAKDVAVIHSIAGQPRSNPFEPPIRSPHHTASGPALVGGGASPVPGEITLAHEGVLFLDEFPEFAPKVLQALREPLETGEIRIARAARRISYPAKFSIFAGYPSKPPASNQKKLNVQFAP